MVHEEAHTVTQPCACCYQHAPTACMHWRRMCQDAGMGGCLRRPAATACLQAPGPRNHTACCKHGQTHAHLLSCTNTAACPGPGSLQATRCCLGASCWGRCPLARRRPGTPVVASSHNRGVSAGLRPSLPAVPLLHPHHLPAHAPRLCKRIACCRGPNPGSRPCGNRFSCTSSPQPQGRACCCAVLEDPSRCNPHRKQRTALQNIWRTPAPAVHCWVGSAAVEGAPCAGWSSLFQEAPSEAATHILPWASQCCLLPVQLSRVAPSAAAASAHPGAHRDQCNAGATCTHTHTQTDTHTCALA
jgi:hypothetical protein